MRINLLHLSDIHISEKNHWITESAKQIAERCYEFARDSNLFLIAVTGDITFGGQKQEYQIAKNFLQEIKSLISAEVTIPVHILVVAGNHDCVLKPDNLIRNTLIDSIRTNEKLLDEEELQEKCTEVQKNFFEFQSDLTDLKVVYKSNMWLELEVFVENYLLRFSIINGAWMSQIPEIQGRLMYPIKSFQKYLDDTSNLRFVLLHQPINWFEQSTYQNLRKALSKKSLVLLTGHEHTQSAHLTTYENKTNLVQFESGALQPDDDETIPEFSILKIDLKEHIIEHSKFQYINKNFVNLEPASTLEFSEDDKSSVVTNLVSENFLNTISDPGGNFSAMKDKVNLDDVFVYPDVKPRHEQGVTVSSISSEQVLRKISDGCKIFFFAEEKAGKTVLLYQAFKIAQSQGLFPVYLNLQDVTSFSDIDIKKIIDSKVANQYVKKEHFEASKKNQRVILLDDLDRLKKGHKFISKIITYLEKHFGALVISADTGFEVTEILDKEAADLLSKYETYEILRFNYKLRLDLVQKWCKLGDVTTLQEYDKKVHKVEEILNSVVGKNLVPSQPIYLLILLQSADQHQQSELQNSSFAYYYQYLITKSLKDVGLKPDKFNELFNYLSNLAWFFSQADIHAASRPQLEGFNRIFSDKYITVDLSERLTLLTRAKILTKEESSYSFTYPYIYYFFVGKYAAQNLSDPNIKDIVHTWCSNLNKRSNAHSVLFLSHHSNDDWVIREISTILGGCFAEYQPIQFNSDTSVLNNLIESTIGITIEAPDVNQNQTKLRQIRDASGDEDLDDNPKNQLEFLAKINLMLRTSEIMGQILKNYYGSLEKKFKAELLRQVVNSPLRLISAILNAVMSDPDAFINTIEGLLNDPEHKKDKQKRKIAAKKLAFRLIGLISTNFIIKSAQNINTDTLEEDIHAFVTENTSNANSLLYAATKLTQAGNIPLELIRKLSVELENNSFAFAILQSMAVYHLYLFHTSADEKQQLCSYLKINMNASNSIDFLNKTKKMLK